MVDDVTSGEENEDDDLPEITFKSDGEAKLLTSGKLES